LALGANEPRIGNAVRVPTAAASPYAWIVAHRGRHSRAGRRPIGGHGADTSRAGTSGTLGSTLVLEHADLVLQPGGTRCSSERQSVEIVKQLQVVRPDRRDNTNQVKERRSKEYYQKEFRFVQKIAKELRLRLSSYGVGELEWARFNELRDDGKGFDEIIRETGIPDLAAASDLEKLRECLAEHDSDRERVWECVQGKIEL